MAKRIFLFILTNILVLTTIGIVLSVLSSVTGVGTYFTADGGIDQQIFNVHDMFLFSISLTDRKYFFVFLHR